MSHRRLAAALACALLLLLVASCSTRSDSGSTVVGGITQVPPAERKLAPVLSGPELGENTTISTADFNGNVLVLNIWGSWCIPCRQEAPALQEASQKTRGKAQFFGINTGDSGQPQAVAFVRNQKVTYPSIFDPSGTELLKFAGTLPPKAIPATLVIDNQGRVAARIIGTITSTTLTDIIDDVAAGK